MEYLLVFRSQRFGVFRNAYNSNYENIPEQLTSVLGQLVNSTDSDTWWRHQMETFSALLALCAGNSLVTGEFPAERLVTRSFDVFFDLRS